MIQTNLLVNHLRLEIVIHQLNLANILLYLVAVKEMGKRESLMTFLFLIQVSKLFQIIFHYIIFKFQKNKYGLNQKLIRISCHNQGWDIRVKYGMEVR